MKEHSRRAILVASSMLSAEIARLEELETADAFTSREEREKFGERLAKLKIAEYDLIEFLTFGELR